MGALPRPFRYLATFETITGKLEPYEACKSIINEIVII